MKRHNKELHLIDIERSLSSFNFFVFANFQGIPAKDFSSLRRALKLSGIGLMVVKNSLVNIALNRLDRGDLSDRLSGPIFMISANDMVEASKALVNMAKQNQDKISILCAYNGAEILEAEDVLYFAKLPSLDDLRIQIMRLISYNIPARLSLCLKTLSKE